MPAAAAKAAPVAAKPAPKVVAAPDPDDDDDGGPPGLTGGGGGGGGGAKKTNEPTAKKSAKEAPVEIDGDIDSSPAGSVIAAVVRFVALSCASLVDRTRRAHPSHVFFFLFFLLVCRASSL